MYRLKFSYDNSTQMYTVYLPERPDITVEVPAMDCYVTGERIEFISPNIVQELYCRIEQDCLRDMHPNVYMCEVLAA